MPTVLVTGASRGLGYEFVRQYSLSNFNVIATCRNPTASSELTALAENHKNVKIHELDIASNASISTLCAFLVQDKVKIDILVNNAGTTPLEIFKRTPEIFPCGYIKQQFGTLVEEVWIETIRINTIAPIMVTQALWPLMNKAANETKIVFISSRFGSLSANYAEFLPYSTSKAALNAAMRKIALNAKTDHVVVASLHPGSVKTSLGGAEAELTPEKSVKCLRHVIKNLQKSDSGRFFDLHGAEIAW